MWILDSSPRQGVTVWLPGGCAERVHAAHAPAFYLHLPDPHLHREMLDALERRYPLEECTFATIFGRLEGYRVGAGKWVAEAVERQTGYTAELYNVDIRADQQWMAERGLFPCGYTGESRFTAEFEAPLRVLELIVDGNPDRDRMISSLRIIGDRTERYAGDERTVLSDLAGIIGAYDPDAVLCPHADTWVPPMVRAAAKYGIDLPFSRSGRFGRLASRSYWSYGRMEHRSAALLPEGRILIDTEQSFTYREGGLPGVLLASRLTGLSPNLTSRFTPGTLISAYEVYEALTRGIAVPFRKRDAERARSIGALRAADKGGMILQPDAGVYDAVYQLDFTSLYPAIIVRFNLSPETLGAPGKRGFLPDALAPLLDLRIRTKQMKKADRGYAGRDAILKWMLVTCFGYTGYRNARFGQIEVHEQITAHARDILVRAKEIAEEAGFLVLHGIVDCLWVQGEPIPQLKERIEEEIGIATELDVYDWIVFLPLADGGGAYNRYFGRLADGSIRVRGILARRRDTPEYVRAMQRDLLAVLRTAPNRRLLAAAEPRAREIYERYVAGLETADPADLAVRRRISRVNYARGCMEASAVEAFRQCGIDVAPGMEIRYVVRDAGRRIADPVWEAGGIDRRYYEKLLDKAWREVAFAFRGKA
ncbi:MAG: type B DNA-directed DNA polymerase [Methanomicrobiaceae archaeon]|uniref:DNA-directed DNA polymerase n=1 Tax=hydrocarbon metagenome TaxID=938273 RepID=A0A0W8FE96_9ZZZZ|nr:type B DNA-directed DNA polymerase [Methanomicrobiaceae archaeon]MDD5419473.1 type B DNA-directed DNA polymerase [Methanomicrobiaceae archaeon]